MPADVTISERPLYTIDNQIGFLLRQAIQKHATVFATHMIETLTPTQWAVLAKLHEVGPLSQNHLGRKTAMDAATVKGVVDRLTARGFVAGRPDAQDARRLTIALTSEGRDIVIRATPLAEAVAEEVLAPLNAAERHALMTLLRKLI